MPQKDPKAAVLSALALVEDLEQLSTTNQSRRVNGNFRPWSENVFQRNSNQCACLRRPLIALAAAAGGILWKVNSWRVPLATDRRSPV